MLKFLVVNGSQRQGSTWHCAEEIVKAVSALTSAEVTRIVLPRDLAQFCRGCFNCIKKSESDCPHAALVAPIVSALEETDIILLTSPVYGMDVSGQMKALLDHLCFQWMSHRPNPRLFHKVGVTVTTAAGAGQQRAAKTMRQSLFNWGVPFSFRFARAVAASGWDEISDRKKARIHADAAKLAKRIVRAAGRAEKGAKPPVRSVYFAIMRAMQKHNSWNPADRAYWEQMGWLAGERPF